MPLGHTQYLRFCCLWMHALSHFEALRNILGLVSPTSFSGTDSFSLPLHVHTSGPRFVSISFRQPLIPGASLDFVDLVPLHLQDHFLCLHSIVDLGQDTSPKYVNASNFPVFVHKKYTCVYAEETFSYVAALPLVVLSPRAERRIHW
jgi:hypothetical protein